MKCAWLNEELYENINYCNYEFAGLVVFESIITRSQCLNKIVSCLH